MPDINLTDPPADPLPLFDTWYADAVDCEQIKYAHAVCLSTVDLDGLPDGRACPAQDPRRLGLRLLWS